MLNALRLSSEFPQELLDLSLGTSLAITVEINGSCTSYALVGWDVVHCQLILLTVPYHILQERVSTMKLRIIHACTCNASTLLRKYAYDMYRTSSVLWTFPGASYRYQIFTEKAHMYSPGLCAH